MMEGGGEGRSLAETPSWAVASVVSVMVVFGFSLHGSLKHFGKVHHLPLSLSHTQWLDRTKRKSVLAALEKIKEEIMLFGLLSLMMGHWIIFVSKICINSSAMSSRFYPCVESGISKQKTVKLLDVPTSNHLNYSVPRQLEVKAPIDFCPEGREPLASRESLEQLHRLMFVLGVTHVFYSFLAIALAMIKIFSWRTWENQAMSMAPLGTRESATSILRMRRLNTFIFHQTAHPWSQHRVLVWLTHELPLSYDFLKYMIRSMEEEFRDIVGINIPLWIFAILCMLLDFHGTNLYFWISFLPAILILVVGTKLHRIVVKLAVEIMNESPWLEFHRFNLRDELFWFGRPRLLLRLIQFISFQNAFEMATFIWSLWEIEDPSCFMENRTFLVIRLTFGIVAQMGSRFKKSIISENVRKSLHGWRKRVRTRHGGEHPFTLLTTSTTSLDSMDDNDDDDDDIERNQGVGSSSREGGSSKYEEDNVISHFRASMGGSQTLEISPNDEMLQLGTLLCSLAVPSFGLSRAHAKSPSLEAGPCPPLSVASRLFVSMINEGAEEVDISIFYTSPFAKISSMGLLVMLEAICAYDIIQVCNYRNQNQPPEIEKSRCTNNVKERYFEELLGSQSHLGSIL
ncbi:hypothetical protein LguiA_005706 [Lonicera macranthoides]